MSIVILIPLVVLSGELRDIFTTVWFWDEFGFWLQMVSCQEPTYIFFPRIFTFFFFMCLDNYLYNRVLYQCIYATFTHVHFTINSNCCKYYKGS